MLRLVPGETFRALERARTRLHDDFVDPLPLATLARAAGLSPYHFVRLFARAYGTTPHQYQVRLRLAHAKRLLGRPDANVTEICFATGFSSLGSFSTRFRREFGRPPSAYARQLRRLYQVPDIYRHVLVPMCFLQHFAPAAISEKHGLAPGW